MELLIYNARSTLTHPHLSVGPDVSDKVTRFLGTVMPLNWHNHCRDTGGFRAISDTLVKYSIPMAAVANPGAARSFLALTRQCTSLNYGSDESQCIEVFFPPNNNNNNNNNTNQNNKTVTGMLFFVHGGAWGSGKPWFYRLCALPFLKLNMAVAIVGYRTYPTGVVADQVCDLQSAYQRLSKEYPDLIGPRRTSRPIGVCVMGHSSGAHIACLMMVEQVKRLMQAESSAVGTDNDDSAAADSVVVLPLVDSFVGISGPYDISNHFDYEAARGVEEFSPLKAANGHTREQFRVNTPQLRLKDFLAATMSPECLEESSVDVFFPRSLLVHGIEDDIVPFTATSEAAHILRSCGITRCDEFYVPLTGHQDAVMHLMLGGRVERGIVDWLQRNRTDDDAMPSMMQSRL
jgi:hypothetical protein